MVCFQTGMVVCTAVKDLQRLQQIYKHVVPHLTKYIVGQEYRELDESQRRTRTEVLDLQRVAALNENDSGAAASVQRNAAVESMGNSIAKDTFRQVVGYNTASKRRRAAQGLPRQARLR